MIDIQIIMAIAVLCNPIPQPLKCQKVYLACIEQHTKNEGKATADDLISCIKEYRREGK